MALHRHDLGRLVLQRVEPMLVACENLDRRDDRCHPHRHREAFLGCFRPVPAQQMPSANAADRERRRQIGSNDRVDEAIGEAGVEDDRQPAVGAGDELADAVDRPALRRLHPAVDAQDPERRNEGAERDHQRGPEMQARPNFLKAEQHDAKEAGLEEESGQHFICHQRPDDRPGLVAEHRPVGTELVGHDDARYDTHGKGDGEDAHPVAEQVEVHMFLRPQPQPLEDGKIARQPDGERREQEVEGYGERELRARQQ